jgi:hypothetical protein
MTQLQQMVYQDAYKRLVDHDHYLAFDLSVLDLLIPGECVQMALLNERQYSGSSNMDQR